MEIRLPVRSYDMQPSVPKDEVLSLDTRQTAFVACHCWNLGMPGGIPVPDAYWVYMGSPQNHAAAAQIITEQIAPAMAAARNYGLPIVHVQPEKVVRRYPHLAVPLSGQHPPMPEAAPLSEQERRRRARVHGEGSAQWLEEQSLDVAEPVRPHEGDVLVAATVPFDAWLRVQGITTLLYTGFATNLGLLDAPAGMRAMAGLGYRCILLREATLAVEFPDTLAQRLNTQMAIRYIETWIGYSASTKEFRRQHA